ncbi:hypothetical protein Vau01_024610 [Virgisporangium aurantiacum]|uniref:Uncharacterized protein n=1 Tax=Virgisporangium aurantiacum TaxID=175570 RepID=A0A8J3Z448_9ACTN|nr:hypothetical protein Vau01_024610 [Virgisporangium aurantiacum]
MFARHVATALARQLALGDLLGDRGWSLDIGTGTATFGTDLRFRVQLLGTESEDDGTWLWAWANTGSALPPALLHAADGLREHGRQTGPAELTEPTFRLDRADGHQLSLLASGLTGRCYYRGPYPGGALFFQLEDVPAQVLAPARPERVLSVLGQVIQAYDVDHRTVVESFLAQQGWQVDAAAGSVTGRHPDGSTVLVNLDGYGRIRDIGGQL